MVVLAMQEKVHYPHQPVAWLWRSAALAILAGCAMAATYEASVEIDGVRHYWLDDDQMISMRYAQNLADGHGLVWNAGERVEGYSNFLWTLVMAAVHLLPMQPAHTSLAIKLINLLLAGCILLLSEKILRTLAPQARHAIPGLLLCLAFSSDLVYWSVNGFEATLLTAIFLLSIKLLLDDSEGVQGRWLPFVLMSTLPLVRVDALFPWLGVGIVALLTRQDRRSAITGILLSLAPVGLHFLWRNHYYGEWLPNTYFLKVDGADDLWKKGLIYLMRFAQAYWLPCVLALLAVRRRADRRSAALLLAVGVGFLFPLLVGKDSFRYSRFLAYMVPLIFILAVREVEDLSSRKPGMGLGLLVTLVLSVLAGTHGTRSVGRIVSTQGNPLYGTIVGNSIKENTLPSARVAVSSAGALPYFSQRPCIDLLGKTDARIAQAAPNVEGGAGHTKMNLALSLRENPELLVVNTRIERIHELRASIQGGEASGTQRVQGYAIALLRAKKILESYLPNPVSLPERIAAQGSLFMYPEGAGLPGKNSWKSPKVGSHRRLDR